MAVTYDPVSLLTDLEPEAGRSLERHIRVAREWFPHEYIPYRLGRDVDKEPWTPDQPRLSGVAQVASEVNLLTEDNLPSYHRLIHGMFGASDGAWIDWVGRWTAEEGRHAIVLRDHVTVTRDLDPVALERADAPAPDRLRPQDGRSASELGVCGAFQEVATRVAHRRTGRFSEDPVADAGRGLSSPTTGRLGRSSCMR